jgi:hypothetical protein
MSGWYVAVSGKARGPVSTETVLAYLKTRSRAEVQVWRDGYDDWRLAKDEPELCVPPPIPLIAKRDPAPATTPEPLAPLRKTRKRQWTKIGAIVGGIYAGFALLIHDYPNSDPFFIGGYLAGATGLAALVGFITGVIGDLVGRKGKSNAAPVAAAIMPAPSTKPGARQNFVARHWRGELPLWVSYWIVGLVAGFGAVAVAVVLRAAFASKSGYYPLSIFATFAGTWACIVVLVGWQLIGTWRSAERYKAIRSAQDRSGFWGGLAQVRSFSAS